MKMNADKMEKKRQEEETDSEGSLKDFVVDGSDTSESSSEESVKSGSDVQCIGSDKEAPVKRRGTRANPAGEIIFHKSYFLFRKIYLLFYVFLINFTDRNILFQWEADPILEVEPEIAEPREWWSEMIKPEHLEDMRISAKLVLLFGILKESEQIGDKV